MDKKPNKLGYFMGAIVWFVAIGCMSSLAIALTVKIIRILLY